MPVTDVVYFRELNGSVSVLDWLTEIGRRDRRAVLKCAARIDMLRQQGHELRRPMADYLRDGIYELRVQAGRVQFRLLYFFHGRNAVVLAHGLVKAREVPDADIERAISSSTVSGSQSVAVVLRLLSQLVVAKLANWIQSN